MLTKLINLVSMILTAFRLLGEHGFVFWCMPKKPLHYLHSVSLTCCCCCCTSILSDHSRVHRSGNPKGPGLWSHRQRGMCCKTTTYQNNHLKYDIYLSQNSYAGFTWAHMHKLTDTRPHSHTHTQTHWIEFHEDTSAHIWQITSLHSHTHRQRIAWISCLLASLI